MCLKVKTYDILWATYENSTRTLHKILVIKLQISRNFPTVRITTWVF